MKDEGGRKPKNLFFRLHPYAFILSDLPAWVLQRPGSGEAEMVDDQSVRDSSSLGLSAPIGEFLPE